MNLFLLLNTNDIFKNVGNQTVYGLSIDLTMTSQWGPSMFGYRHSSKYLPLSSTEDLQAHDSSDLHILLD